MYKKIDPLGTYIQQVRTETIIEKSIMASRGRSSIKSPYSLFRRGPGRPKRVRIFTRQEIAQLYPQYQVV